ncbi:hypothetical protein QBC36DRAFT_327458 [Triangularia setosa]|uniref:Uncharacterized protein n=1 Tax=Triangularia setosa TaxID=2587417 RepID=A0AAN6W8A0_9PEZI|nr:hypothetical protein QBC36DRAFT_327458 [Podospora setosa]
MTAIDGLQSSPTQPAPDQAPPYVRLHVTPLDANLLKVILSSALLPKARNISYHTLETFPDKRYGYLDLPSEDADKLKQKLNGSILRGVKIRIERAKPSRIPTPLGNEAMAKEKKVKKVKDDVRPENDKSKKRKRDRDEISGVVLENDRKVKRGWTTADEPKEKRSKRDKKDSKDKKKKQERSKYTGHAECLVKTILPANAAPSAENDTRSKKKKGKSREVVVHEFEKTTKFPTFLKTTVSYGPSKTPLEFVEGQGWVDEDGNVVEAVKVTAPPPTFKISARKKVEQSESEPSSSDSDSGEESDNDDESDSPSSPTKAASTPKTTAQPKSDPIPQQHTSPLPSALSPELSRPKSSGSVKSLAIKIPPATPSEPKMIHPLEALYKRSQQTDGKAGDGATESKGFSFFGGGDVDSDNEDIKAAADGLQIPMTPFTRQDFEIRGIRSAAPTPDTAHPMGGRFKPWDDHDEDMEYDDDHGEYLPEDNEQPSASTAQADAAEGDKPASDFQKWFWENRGDLNRSWKKRRKTAGKEKRYRENRTRMARAI